MSQCRLQRLSDYYWYPTIGIDWGGRVSFTILHIRGTDDLLRFKEKQEATDLIEKWERQGLERLPDIYSLQFDLRDNLNSDFSI